jgi:hypothetical protein
MTDSAQVASPESRLLAAGFSSRVGFWVTPDGTRVLSLDDAIAGLDSGEIQPGGPTVSLPDASVRAFPDELVDRICSPPQPPGEPPTWLLAQADVIATATVEKMKPLIRAEVRAALRSKAATS